MQRRELKDSRGARWVDVTEPSAEDLAALAAEFSLSPMAAAACLEPEHFPKHEALESSDFFVFRIFDDLGLPEADTAQELTRKVAVFVTPDLFLTIHRAELKRVSTLFSAWEHAQNEPLEFSKVLYQLAEQVVLSYEAPIDQALDALENFEMGVFSTPGSPPADLQTGYLLKRKSSVYRRLLRTTVEIFRAPAGDRLLKRAQRDRLVDICESALQYCDELSESTTSLLTLHLSFAAQRTNEVVRVLTVFSMFLLPLTVVTGVYGMNFEHMPELKWPWGYGFALGLMVAISLGLFAWFKSRGWLKAL